MPASELLRLLELDTPLVVQTFPASPPCDRRLGEALKEVDEPSEFHDASYIGRKPLGVK